MDFFNGELYVGGEFTQSGANVLGNVARWNGSEWVSAGIAVAYNPEPPFPFVHTMKTVGDKLYALGGFNQCTDANGNDIPCGGILAFDGMAWDGMDGGLSGAFTGESEAIFPYEGGILVGGDFTSAGGITTNSMALWGVISSTAETASLPVAIFPNPSDGWFQLQLPAEATAFNYRLLSSTGQIVQTGNGRPGQPISTPALTTGLYMLQGECETGVFQTKMIVR